VATHIGARLRAARLAQGLSLRGVAEAVGVSASLVSQVETGKTQPSVSTLYAMVSHLGISMDDLLEAGDPPPRRRAPRSEPEPASTGLAEPHDPHFGHDGRNPVLEMENGVRWERLASGDDGPADALLVTYEPGGSSSIEGRLMRHSGIEYAYLLEGELTLQLEFETFVLRAGDSLQFDSVRPHLYANHGPVPARGVWFVVGRRRPGDAPVSRASGP
jgi:Predicted transcriptional regulators